MRNWSTVEEAERLHQRFAGVKQAAFAREHNVPGGASMLSQHIKGRRPLNLEAAVAYAKGFGVTLEEISPRLAEEVRKSQALIQSPLPVASASVAQVPDVVRVIEELAALLLPLDAADREQAEVILKKVALSPENAPQWGAKFQRLLGESTGQKDRSSHLRRASR